MRENFQTLLEEMKDSFPDMKSEKEFKQGLKDFKNFQTSLAPEKEFQENLKSRLEGVYFLKQQKKAGFWTNLKTWMNIAGFAFLLPLFMYIGYSLYFQNRDTPVITPVPEDFQENTFEDFQEDTDFTRINNDQDFGERRVSDGENEEIIQVENQKVFGSEQGETKKQSTQKVKTPNVKIPNIETPDITTQKPKTQNTPRPQVENKNSTSQQIKTPENVPAFLPPETPITPPVADAPEIQESRIMQRQIFPNSVSPTPSSASMMMLGEPEGTADDLNQESREILSEFQIFCEEEKDGVFSETDNTCELSNGELCTEDERNMCSLENEKTEEQKMQELEKQFENMLEGFSIN